EVPILRGRVFNEGDTESSQQVIIINQAMVRRYWPNQDPVGQRMSFGESPKQTFWRTIVGVIGDMRHASLSDAAVPTAFISFRQDREAWARMCFVIKADHDPAGLTAAVRQEIIAIDPNQPVYNIQPLGKLMDNSVASRRFVMLLVGCLSFIALALAL